MGDRQEARVTLDSKPFTWISLDFFGPVVVKAMTNKRAHMKTWPILMVCNSTGAVHAACAHDYSTEAFILQFQHYVALRGCPARVVSDRGSQLTSKENIVAAKDSPAGYDWEQLKAQGDKEGVEWTFVEAGCQFRNGLVERRVASTKAALNLMLSTTIVANKPTLHYAQLCTILARVATVVNDRPVAVASLSDFDIVGLTINQLLLGRTTTSSMHSPCSVPEDASASTRYMEDLMQCWWKHYKERVFPHLLPYSRYKEARRHANLQPGDVCHLRYDNKICGQYRLCVVKEIKVSKDNIVRTVVVAFCPKKSLRPGQLYKSTHLEEMQTAVQRLVLLVPVEERVSGHVINDQATKNND